MTYSAPAPYADPGYDGGRSTSAPALFWPTLSTSEFGLTRCMGGPIPDRNLYAWQARARMLRIADEPGQAPGADPRLTLALQPFLEALVEAQARIYVLDAFAFDHALPVVAEAMSVTFASDVRVLSKRDTEPRTLLLAGRDGGRSVRSVTLKQAVTAMQDARDEALTERGTGVVQWRFLDGADQEMVHDRFALVDDDLWHWGASVGGLHRGIHAASHGWRTAAPAFEALFLELWTKGGRIA